jgi:hypothetical protein
MGKKKQKKQAAPAVPLVAAPPAAAERRQEYEAEKLTGKRAQKKLNGNVVYTYEVQWKPKPDGTK